MARRSYEDDWEDDEPSWDDSDDDYNDDSDDDDDTVPCPYCRREIHEDAERCPYCERYISDEDSPPARKPWWVIAAAILCLYVMFRWLVG